MSKPNFFILFFTTLFCFAAAFAQTDTKLPVENSYEITLQVVLASKNAAGKTPTPQNLAPVVKKLKETNPISNYYLSSTYFQRITNSGNLDFKGFSSVPNQTADVYAPVFSEWIIGQLLVSPNASGANTVQMKNFRFGQRIPIKIAQSKDTEGRQNDVINYENVGLSMQKINLSENTPTIIGNISGSSTDETIYLILTIKPAQD